MTPIKNEERVLKVLDQWGLAVDEVFPAVRLRITSRSHTCGSSQAPFCRRLIRINKLQYKTYLQSTQPQAMVYIAICTHLMYNLQLL